MSNSISNSLKRWFDNANPTLSSADFVGTVDKEHQLDDLQALERVDWVRVLPFVIIHVACLAIFFVGWSSVAVATAIALYLVRMFAITSFYHRYFSHKSFKTSRFTQFLFAAIAASATQRGPLWWAAHHRDHHRHSDTELDAHSPRKGFFWSHMGWFLSNKHFDTKLQNVKDFAKFPELVWLDRFDMVVPIILIIALYFFGLALEVFAPNLGASGLQMIVWGYLISTVVLFHATVSINSLAHKIGTQPFPTQDDSRNNWLLAFITLGEGWHNNHHFAPGTVRQGFHWWQIDMSYYLLRLMAVFGLVWDLKPIPNKVQAYYLQQSGKELR